MAAPVRRSASTLFWASPTGRACTLTPMSGGRGLLELEIIDDVVAVHSRNCLLNTDDEDFQEIAELEMTISLQRCQINWTMVERAEADEIERSQFFKQ